MRLDIPGGENFQRIEKINLGWSKDIKYYIETINQEKLICRINDISAYESKKREYAMMCKLSGLGFPMSQPSDFGISHNGKHVYLLHSYVEGETLETVLPKLSQEEQYKLGFEAGEILKKIHQLEVPAAELPSQSKLPKKLRQLQSYRESSLRIPNDEMVLQFILENIHKIGRQKPTYVHGDFHPGNLILTPEGRVAVIDFNRCGVGDPYEEFYKLESFSTESSIPFCRGQIDAYFNQNVPKDFWEALAVYSAHAALYSIKWAEPFGDADINNMKRICAKIFYHYDYFKRLIPSWYED